MAVYFDERDNVNRSAISIEDYEPSGVRRKSARCAARTLSHAGHCACQSHPALWPARGA